MQDAILKSGLTRFFEYHCYEGHDSNDAELWYHSHQEVQVGQCCNPEYAEGTTWKERMEEGIPLVYSVKFQDGFQGDVFEDELLLDENQYERPDPPKISLTT